jgi:hypothetical protein
MLPKCIAALVVRYVLEKCDINLQSRIKNEGKKEEFY